MLLELPAIVRGKGRGGNSKAQIVPRGSIQAQVAESVDALDLGSSGETRGGSSPPLRTSCILTREFSATQTNAIS